MSPIRIIQAKVAAYYRVTLDELLGPKRHRPLVHQRQLAMYLSRNMTSSSLPAIGRAFRGRDHTTVLWAVRAVTRRLAVDPSLLATTEALGIAIAASWAECRAGAPLAKLFEELSKVHTFVPGVEAPAVAARFAPGGEDCTCVPGTDGVRQHFAHLSSTVP